MRFSGFDGIRRRWKLIQERSPRHHHRLRRVGEVLPVALGNLEEITIISVMITFPICYALGCKVQRWDIWRLSRNLRITYWTQNQTVQNASDHQPNTAYTAFAHGPFALVRGVHRKLPGCLSPRNRKPLGWDTRSAQNAPKLMVGLSAVPPVWPGSGILSSSWQLWIWWTVRRGFPSNRRRLLHGRYLVSVHWCPDDASQLVFRL